MKRERLILLLLLFMGGMSVRAQHGGKEKVEALRVAFITKRLDLSAAETEKFWPIYNEYQDKAKALKKNLRQAYKQKSEPLSEQDAEELYKLDLQTHKAEAELYQVYNERLKAVIGTRKLIRLHVAEEDFRRELIKTIREGGGD